MKPTYSEQWQKITSAYLNDKLNPYHPCACFIGNLLNNQMYWIDGRDGGCFIPNHRRDGYMKAIGIIKEESGGLYSPKEIYLMEKNFLSVINNNTTNSNKDIDNIDPARKNHPNYENALYSAMVSTLELLKQIHISKGEDVDNGLVLTKRQTSTT